ncbi:AraC family transcriptional regulator [Dactylosporangium sp. NPDC051541]|uniref:AraC family transcriptional regulator n=1 Tax=Dactylosporangium sp. NPDC051541 TaxID=3363977 RepID=UPI003797DAD7
MTPHVPVEWTRVETADFDAAHEFLRRRYAEHSLRGRRPTESFLFRSRLATAGELAVDVVTHRAGLKVSSDPFDSVVMLVILEGHYGVRAGGEELAFSPGDVLMFPIGVPFDVSWDHVVLQMTRLPLAAVQQAGARDGVEAADFRFDALRPVSAEKQRLWSATASYVSRMFAGPEPGVNHPLLHAAVLETAAAAALTVFPNTTMTVAYTPGPGRVPPAVVRRAKAFVDAHADEPITSGDIAAAAGVTVRGLQAAFVRHWDTTPSGYLRRVRLERAHRDLQLGDPARGDTVAGIARRWGFGKPGRFAVEYHKVYGRPPSHTLRI